MTSLLAEKLQSEFERVIENLSLCRSRRSNTAYFQFFAIIVIADMHVVERGSGAAHIWLHCFLGSSRNLQSLSTGLAGRHLFPDLRSHGLSPAAPVTVEDMADDVLRLMDRKGLTNVSIIGHSMGGKVAMCAIGKQPQRFQNVVILDVAPVDYTKTLAEGAKRVQEGVRYSQLQQVCRLKIAGKTQQNVLEALNGIFKSKSMVSLLTENLSEVDGSLSWTCDLPSLTAGYMSIGQWSRSQQKFPGEALVLAAEHSKHVTNLPSLSSAVTVESLFSHCFSAVEVRVIRGASHWLYVEQEAQVRAEIHKYLESQIQHKSKLVS